MAIQQNSSTIATTPPMDFPQDSNFSVWLYRHRSGLLGSCSIIAILAAWQICASTGLVQEGFSSSPWLVAKALGSLVTTGHLFEILDPTLVTLGWGLLIAIVVGVPLGLLIGRSQTLHYLTQPVINILYSVPYVTFLPVLILWFGIGIDSRVVVVIWSAIMPIIINTRAGGRVLDRDYQRVSAVFCASRTKAFFKVALPAAVPYILAGLRLAIAQGLIGTIVAEFFLGSEGIGYYVQSQTSLFDMNNAIAAICLLIVIAFILNWIITRVESRFAHWSS
ncbi:MAG TPA: ABC transporter permease [Trebonia sp.]|jgi:ABC-type nitrate/sulfonate/bicarbonate transport system permease component|nr:ABC transporter permease [Trebonia sp.]